MSPPLANPFFTRIVNRIATLQKEGIPMKKHGSVRKEWAKERTMERMFNPDEINCNRKLYPRTADPRGQRPEEDRAAARARRHRVRELRNDFGMES